MSATELANLGRCSQCGRLKTDATRWYIGYRLHERSGPRFQTTIICGFKILKWTRKRYETEGAESLCGRRCSQIFADRVMDEMEKPPAPSTVVTPYIEESHVTE